MLRRIVVLAAVAGAASAAPCLPGSLAVYAGLGAGGCSIGALQFANFSFAVVAAGGGIIPLTANDILVTPTLPVAGETNLDFAAAWSAVGSEFVSYGITYTVDPPPIIIPNFDLELFTFTPVAPGIATVTADICFDAIFPLCPTASASLQVFHDGIAPVLFDSTGFPIAFNPAMLLDVRARIDLQANGASSSFSSFAATARFVPEPSSGWMLAAGLAAGLFKLAQIRLKLRP